MDDTFISEIGLFSYAGTKHIPPRGWLLCDGSLLSTAQFETLYSLIGNIYGGDGKDTFRLPDLRGKAPMQCGQGEGLSKHVLGESGGTKLASLHCNQIPYHRHEAKVVHDEADTSDPEDAYLAYDDSPDVKVYKDYASAHGNYKAMNLNSLETAGQGQGHENRQPYLALHFCIAFIGDYPPRP